MSDYFDRADAYICVGVLLALAGGGVALANTDLLPLSILLGGLSGCVLLVGLVARGVQIGLDISGRR